VKSKLSNTIDIESIYDGKSVVSKLCNFGSPSMFIYNYRFVNDKEETHNENGPAVVDFFPETDKIRSIQYYQNGKLHREGGPASILFYENGDIKIVGYYLNGVCVSKEQANENIRV
jgi:antitoxin component YwqK of YwqJK toxin-antitoxin module